MRATASQSKATMGQRAHNLVRAIAKPRPAARSRFAVLLGIAAAGTMAGTASAAERTFYISPTGNDANAGTTSTAPWRTIDKVSRTPFQAGDRVLFEGSQTFAGRLYFDSGDAGTAVAPITVSSYGSGRATLDGGDGDAMLVYNQAGFRVADINVRGSGSTTNTGSGVSFYSDLPGDLKLDGVQVTNVDSQGFGESGVIIGSWNGRTGYRNVDITRVTAHGNGRSGVSTYGQAYPAHDNVYVGNSKTYDNWGLTSSARNSGSGIVLGSVTNSKVERSVAYNNGERCIVRECGAGIWTYDSDHVTLQYNESYDNRNGSGVDGDGFDLDQNVSYSVVQYNYSHGNAGPGFLVCQAAGSTGHHHNVVRYNVSENDVRKNAMSGSIALYGNIVSDQFYSNTIYVSPGTGGPSSAVTALYRDTDARTGQSVIRDNIFYTSGASTFVDFRGFRPSTATFLFQGNDYYNSLQTGFAVKWGSATYASLDAWRAATGEERSGTRNTGSTANPRLIGAGKGGTIGDATRLHTLQAYKLDAASPLVDRGERRTGIDPGLPDYYGTSTARNGAYDVGAFELPLTTFAMTTSVSPSTTAPIGSIITLKSSFTAKESTAGIVDTEVWGNARVLQSYTENVTFRAGETRTYTRTWNTAGLAPGVYTIYQGAFTSNWAKAMGWRAAGTITLR